MCVCVCVCVCVVCAAIVLQKFCAVRPVLHGWQGNCEKQIQTNLGVFQRPLTLILLKKYRGTNGRRIVIQIGGVYSTFRQEEGIFVPKYRDKNGRCMAILFKSIGVRGRFDSLDKCPMRPNSG